MCIRDSDYHRVKAELARVLDRELGRLHDVRLPALEYRHAHLIGHDLQLRYRGRAVYVARHQQRTLALFLYHQAELAGHRRLARALQAAAHVYRGHLSLIHI